MRHLTLTESHPAAPGLASSAEQSALQMTRAAIARWSGSARPASARDLVRVSPQARWVAEAQDGLANWIARGGFGQADEHAAAPLTGPVMYRVGANSDACID
ncbi:MAG: hypothetical protein V4631_01625 [Pseudomonadota bacterium]